MTDSAGATGPLSVSILGGTVGFMREAGMPFQRELMAGLTELGFTNEATDVVEASFPALPPFPTGRQPTAAVGIDDVVVGLGVYLLAKLSDQVISEISSDIF